MRLKLELTRDWRFGYLLLCPSETRLPQSELFLYLVPPFYVRLTWHTEP